MEWIIEIITAWVLLSVVVSIALGTFIHAAGESAERSDQSYSETLGVNATRAGRTAR